MKLALAWLALIVLATATAGSCTINHKSNDFECNSSAECNGGRSCVGGYCVLPGGIDASRPPTDGPPVVVDAPVDGTVNNCPAQCTSCAGNTHTCKIDCAVTSCNGPVVCPAGWNCDVECTTASTCRSGVTCPATGTCTVNCAGQSSCRDVACGAGRCNVTCAGQGSCRGDTDCNQSCACDVACKLGASCENVECTSFQCDTGLGCSSMLSSACSTCM